MKKSLAVLTVLVGLGMSSFVADASFKRDRKKNKKEKCCQEMSKKECKTACSKEEKGSCKKK
jgi:hypothetical protein